MSGEANDETAAASDGKTPFVERDDAETWMTYDRGGRPWYLIAAWVAVLVGITIYGIALLAPDLRDVGAAVSEAAAAGCAHCGLPCAAGDSFCCWGCQLAAELAAEGNGQQGQMRAALLLCVLFGMCLMSISLFLFGEDVYHVPDSGGLGRLRELARVGSALLATPVLLLLGVPLLRRAAAAAARGRLTMDLLVAIGVFAAYGLSLWSIVARRPGVYFDSAVAALLLTSLGRYLEASARARASRLVGPGLEVSGQAEVRAADGSWQPLAIARIEPGMRVRVPVEAVVPVNGRVAGSPVEVNLAVLTGELAPVARHDGDEVPAGAVPLSGPLELVATRRARESAVEQLAALARGLRERRGRLQRLADRFAAALVPAVALLALASLLWWTRAGSIDQAVVVSLAVVLAACPCTYGVATPLALWLGMRKALEHGVLVRDAAALEALAGARAVAFDKTGTLTDATLALAALEPAPGVNPADALALAAALEGETRHPVGRALVAAAAAAGVAPAPLAASTHQPGAGVVGTDTAGRPVAIGAAALLRAQGVDVAAAPAGAVLLCRDGRLLASFWFDERIRPEAAAAIAALRSAGLATALLTGDDARRAEPVGRALGIDAVHAGLTAAGKVERLERLGRRGGVVMVGDGLNDAPALAGVTGVAIGGATSLARGVARVALARANLLLVPWAIELARSVRRRLRANLALSTLYNLVFVGLAAAGRLRPTWAALAMVVSSVLVLVETLRLAALPGPAGGAAAVAPAAVALPARPAEVTP